MNFEFSEEHNLLREQARGFLKNAAPFEDLRGAIEGEADFSNLWNGVCELGWTATSIPEAYGGLGLGYLELCVISEEIGRSLASVPFSSSVFLVSELLARAGSDKQKQAWLPRLAAGDVVGALGGVDVSEQLASGDVGALYHSGKLSGYIAAVPDGSQASLLVVLAHADEGPTLCLVDLSDQNGIERQTAKTLDGGRPAAHFRFDQALAEPIGVLGSAREILPEILNRAAVLIAFEQLGGAERAMEAAIDYAKERRAFGQPIGAFQAIKHKLSDLYVLCALARANAYYGAWAIHTDADELPLAAAAARISATEAFSACAAENIQIHGGMGFTWEGDSHLFYRRAQFLRMMLGAPMVWKERLMQRLELRNQT